MNDARYPIHSPVIRTLSQSPSTSARVCRTTLSGFKSRWMIFFEWRYSMAFAMSWAMWRTSDSGSPHRFSGFEITWNISLELDSASGRLPKSSKPMLNVIFLQMYKLDRFSNDMVYLFVGTPCIAMKDIYRRYNLNCISHAIPVGDLHRNSTALLRMECCRNTPVVRPAPRSLSRHSYDPASSVFPPRSAIDPWHYSYHLLPFDAAEVSLWRCSARSPVTRWMHLENWTFIFTKFLWCLTVCRKFRSISLDTLWVIPCQINQFFAKFASHPSDFDEIWHTCR